MGYNQSTWLVDQGSNQRHLLASCLSSCASSIASCLASCHHLFSSPLALSEPMEVQTGLLCRGTFLVRVCVKQTGLHRAMVFNLYRTTDSCEADSVHK